MLPRACSIEWYSCASSQCSSSSLSSPLRARAMGAGLVQLTTDKSRKDAHRFYERLGFKASHEGMKLDLT